MPTFITPFSGTAELTASNGLAIIDQAQYTFSLYQYNDSATFGLSLGGPHRAGQGVEPLPTQPITGGLLHLRGENWTIAGVGNTLTSYTDPDTHVTYTAAQCRISVTGRWQVIRQPNFNSFNGVARPGEIVISQSDSVMYIGNVAGALNPAPILAQNTGTPPAALLGGFYFNADAGELAGEGLYFCANASLGWQQVTLT